MLIVQPTAITLVAAALATFISASLVRLVVLRRAQVMADAPSR